MKRVAEEWEGMEVHPDWEQKAENYAGGVLQEDEDTTAGTGKRQAAEIPSLPGVVVTPI